MESARISMHDYQSLQNGKLTLCEGCPELFDRLQIQASSTVKPINGRKTLDSLAEDVTWRWREDGIFY